MTPRHAVLGVALGSWVLAAACGADDEIPGEPPTTTSLGASGGVGGTGGSVGTGGTAGQPPDPSAACVELGLPSLPFQPVEPSADLYALAADLVVPTTAGEISLEASWSGCDSLFFVQDEPRQNAGWPVGIWERDVNRLFARLPPNVQLFFVSVHADPVERDASFAELMANVDTTLAAMPADEAARWAARVHYVTTPADELASWLGTMMADPGWGIAIDRAQRIRFIGSYADYARYDAGEGWFAPNLSMLANEALYYNFEAERQARLDAESATVVELFTGQVVSDPSWEGLTTTVDVALPDALEMSDYDTLELDLSLGCEGEGEFGDCPAWDYDVDLRLCDEIDPAVCTLELGHWISAYHREGRWVHDVSGLLPLLAAGGTRRFAFYSQQPYEVTLALRLSSQQKAARPSETTMLWAGSVTFDELYNDAFEPLTVPIAADAVKVELVTVLSGHGMSQPGNCAEFCNTEHTFYVNGLPNPRSFPQAGDSNDCMEQTETGTVPNQYGTWWYGRAGWCPGREVPAVAIDVTDQVLLGQDNLFEYEAFYQGQPYVGDDWRHIRLVSAVVVSK